MRYLFVILSLLGTVSSFSQKWFQDHKTWKYNVTTGLDMSNYGIHILKVQPGDTTILNKKCKKITWQGISYSPFPEYYSEEDSKVSYYHPFDKKYYLLYDFNLKVGDSLNTKNRRGIIDKAGMTNVNNREYKWQLVKFTAPNGINYYDYFVEGIGLCPDINSIGASIYCGYFNYLNSCMSAVDGWDYFLVCVKDNIGSYPTENCGVSGVQQITREQIIIKPNPAADDIEIISPSEISSIDFYNSSGVKIQSVSHTKYIETASLPFGIYFLKIQTINREIITKKLVKL